ncbi:hypothetical protein PAPYR_8716 [Paratrimastix pyriformis]|uniref:C3H1-type domain-containing protein n=1 Tax=Paratrimastix pyriformis TaxID=342808 RepID=A0ABQ8UFS9_9EUKA|nr:hypothetical protein PAPYR_8716 [Paratrimastix pyriformis]
MVPVKEIGGFPLDDSHKIVAVEKPIVSTLSIEEQLAKQDLYKASAFLRNYVVSGRKRTHAGLLLPQTALFTFVHCFQDMAIIAVSRMVSRNFDRVCSIRSTRSASVPIQKGQTAFHQTVVCRSYALTGHCKYGQRCRFIHETSTPLIVSRPNDVIEQLPVPQSILEAEAQPPPPTVSQCRLVDPDAPSPEGHWAQPLPASPASREMPSLDLSPPELDHIPLRASPSRITKASRTFAASQRAVTPGEDAKQSRSGKGKGRPAQAPRASPDPSPLPPNGRPGATALSQVFPRATTASGSPASRAVPVLGKAAPPPWCARSDQTTGRSGPASSPAPATTRDPALPPIGCAPVDQSLARPPVARGQPSSASTLQLGVPSSPQPPTWQPQRAPDGGNRPGDRPPDHCAGSPPPQAQPQSQSRMDVFDMMVGLSCGLDLLQLQQQPGSPAPPGASSPLVAAPVFMALPLPGPGGSPPPSGISFESLFAGSLGLTLGRQPQQQSPTLPLLGSPFATGPEAAAPAAVAPSPTSSQCSHGSLYQSTPPSPTRPPSGVAADPFPGFSAGLATASEPCRPPPAQQQQQPIAPTALRPCAPPSGAPIRLNPRATAFLPHRRGPCTTASPGLSSPSPALTSSIPRPPPPPPFLATASTPTPPLAPEDPIHPAALATATAVGATPGPPPMSGGDSAPRSESRPTPGLQPTVGGGLLPLPFGEPSPLQAPVSSPGLLADPWCPGDVDDALAWTDEAAPAEEPLPPGDVCMDEDERPPGTVSPAEAHGGGRPTAASSSAMSTSSLRPTTVSSPWLQQLHRSHSWSGFTLEAPACPPPASSPFGPAAAPFALMAAMPPIDELMATAPSPAPPRPAILVPAAPPVPPTG